MPGWKALPEELDPEVRAFTELIRRLIDRSGLGVVAVAERAGHERAVWDAYLNARRPMPRGAVIALAEVTGADPADLATRWERARGRFAPGAVDGGVPGGPAAEGPRTEDPRGEALYGGASGGPATGGLATGGPRGGVPGGPAAEGLNGGVSGGPAPRSLPDHADRPGDGLPGDDRTMRIRRVDPPGPAEAPVPAEAPTPAAVPPPGGGRPAPSRPPGGAPPARRRRTTVLLYAAGILGALLVVTAALLLVDLGGGGDGTDGADGRAAAPPTTTAPSPAPRTDLPGGVKCSGADCAGRDPEAMGCGGPLAVTVDRVRVGTARVEVRHSATCAASWARITGAAPGDTVSVEVAGATERATVPEGADPAAETDAYTPMLAVAPRAAARACGTLADGTERCTAGR
ncbi:MULTISPECIES: helix-turn-helix domain-containing protein [unclassified Streptomyces]|uniref:helix-turn-helix domain-containing protein n=1 Tax=unclassified Streptomyces TaxID=2593676 RepID=UPI0006AEB804|nr:MULTISPECIES: XRE family transcriptional regulator [unclassified Streptomyces]KOX17214.1 hypothetical protein ADL06_32490 [Streptomyces sp. NRRL F-6491]KOX49968.1 hypothetical protein ADL08_07135 [Streptomyces sp. NRRL F-6492]